MSTEQQVTDWWGFVSACKHSVNNALQNAKFNHGNRAANVAVMAVLRMINTTGAKLDKMYASVGTDTGGRNYYASPLASVCTAKANALVHNANFEPVDSFGFEMSWMKDPREPLLDAAARLTYVENLLYARAILEAANRRGEMNYPPGYQVSIGHEWSEMKENSRPMA